MSSIQIRTLTDSEIPKLLNYLSSVHTKYKKTYCIARDTLILLLMLDAGLRVGELVGLLSSDLYNNDEVRSQLLLWAEITKTKEERVIPLSSRIRDSAKSYLVELKCLYDDQTSRPLFTDPRGVKPMSERQIQRIVNYVTEKSIGWMAHPHTLRHTFATRALRVSDTRTVQLLLGHKSLTSTQVYVHPGTDELMKTIDKMSPPSLPLDGQ